MKNFILNKKQQIEKRGFTLVETLVAIFILTISIMGPMAAAQSSLKASFIARDQITAFYLAQDSIESVKALRDSVYVDNVKNGDTKDWLYLLNSDSCEPTLPNNPSNICRIFNNEGGISLDPATPVTDYFVYLIDGEFTNKTGTDEQKTKYKRKVKLTRISDDELKITVEIEWTGNFLSGTRKIVVQENIYDWFKFN